MKYCILEAIEEAKIIAANIGLSTEFDSKKVNNISIGDETCLLMKQDNIQALMRLLASEIHVDFTYIDPPYNTGNNFLYNDTRQSSSVGFWGKNKPWAEFMLPRLVFAKKILKDDGVIAISIDDYAYAHLKILLDSIFGETCCLGTIVVKRSSNGLGSNKNIADMHEYVLLYGKSTASKINGISEESDKNYPKSDEFGQFSTDGLFRKKGEDSLREDRPNMFYPLYVSKNGKVFTERVSSDLMEVYPIDSKGVERRWLWGKEKATSDSWKLYSSPKGVIYVKNYKSEDKKVKVRSIFSKPSYLTDAATREIKEIFGEKLFDTPKPLGLISDLITACSNENALVFDFFAGSGTTAEAVAFLNQKNKSNRKVILVETNDLIESNHLAKKYGFSKISDLTEYRIKKTQNTYNLFSYRIADQ